MGNGVMPNGLSYRAHPRLYPKRRSIEPADGRLAGAKLPLSRNYTTATVGKGHQIRRVAYVSGLIKGVTMHDRASRQGITGI
jgi:hypothetical protein